MWQKQEDVSKPEIMRECLARCFSAKEVEDIMKATGTKEVKDGLLATTDDALENGAYGCPWFHVTDSNGKKEPFFGSDR
jgi:glutathione S-transferase kappa 1